MKLQRILSFLVFALPVLIVGFGSLMAGSTLARATGDALGAQIMSRLAGALAILLAMDMVLLMGSLGVRAVAEDHWRDLRWQRRRNRRRRGGAGNNPCGGEDRHPHEDGPE